MKPPAFRWTALTVGALLGVAHIGVIGHLIKPSSVVETPTFNIPNGPYSSYRIRSGRDGYEIEYRANDPLVLESERSLNLDKERKGWFGGGSEQRTEHRRDQYTMDGVRNIGGPGGEIDEEGKSSARDVECIVADAGARSQGALAGSTITTGLIAPAVMSIPYVGWLAAGWATLLGQQVGSDLGSQVGSVFNDC